MFKIWLYRSFTTSHLANFSLQIPHAIFSTSSKSIVNNTISIFIKLMVYILHGTHGRQLKVMRLLL